MDQRRRDVLQAAIALPALAVGTRAFAPDRGLTPSCGKATPPATAGPFYTPDSPAKADFREDDPQGRSLDLRATVLDARCRPMPGAMVDLWHANSQGRYDTAGFRLRGHQRADERGTVRFATVLPGRYPGRARHFHVRIFGARGGTLLTTQLYFPGEPGNGDDWLFVPELLLDVARRQEAMEARYSFVVPA